MSLEEKPQELRYVRDIEVSQGVEILYRDGVSRGLSAGWVELDEYWRLRKGEWTLLTGIPGHGKSTFLDNVVINTAKEHSWKWGIFSAENHPVQRHLSSLLEIYTGKPFGIGPSQRLSRSELQTGLAFLDTHLFFIEPNEEDRTVERLLCIAKYLHEEEQVDALVIDPWNELDHRRPSGMTETEYISQSLSRIRMFAREHDCHVVLVAHPAKMQKDHAGNYPIPTPYDVSGSAHWRNKADCALCVWRDTSTDADEVEIYVQKIRFREVGKLGSVTLGYDRVSNRVVNRSVYA